MKTNILYRLVLLSTSLTFLFIVLSLLNIAKNPVQTYEFSIYSSTPIIFWISVILGLINGFLLVYLRIADKIKRIYILGIFEILFVNFLVLTLYSLRNYILCMLRGDVPDYIGYIKDVSIYGNIRHDIYPFTSILVSQIDQILNISAAASAKYIPAIFYIFSVFSAYCLSKSLIRDEKYRIFAVVAATPLFFAWFYTGIYYMLISVLTLPFFFYLLFNLKDWRFKVLIVIYLYIYPFFHPITSMVVLFYLFILYLTQKYPFKQVMCKFFCKLTNLNKLLDRKFHTGRSILPIVHKNLTSNLPQISDANGISCTLLIISSICLIFWYITAYAIIRSLYKIIANVLGMFDTPSAMDQATYAADKLGLLTTVKTISFLLFDEITFYILAGIAIYLIVFKSDLLERKRFVPIIACFISGNLLLLFLFTSTFAHRPDRLLNLNFNMMFAPILVAYVIYINRKNRLKTLFLICLILFATVSTYFSLYQSPITSRGNDYMTLTEYHGANWLLINKNPSIKTVDLANPISYYASFIYGAQYRDNNQNLQRSFLLPDHFGFTAHFDDWFPMDQDRYFVLSPYDEVCYTNIWKNSNRFEVEDFKKVDACKNVFKVFENGGFKTYLIRT